MRVKPVTMAIVLLLAGCASSNDQSRTTDKPVPQSAEAQNVANKYHDAFEGADAIKFREYLDRSTDARSKLADAIIDNAKATLSFRKIWEQESSKSQTGSSFSIEMNLLI